MPDFSSLAATVTGPVLTPADDGFTAEVTGFNLYYAHTPEVVVGVTSTADAVAAVRFAHEHRMPIQVLSTGHGSHSLVGGGMLVTTRRLDHLALDVAARSAAIGAGVRWGAVVAAAAEHGLAPITGSSTNVGVVGYLLGGGMGPLARSHGFSSDYVRGYTVVLPTGEVVEASVDDNAELFWALRGGKGGLGLVVEVRLALVELATLYGGALIFAEENIEAATRAWVDFTATAPDDVTTSAAIVHFPPVEQVPEMFRGKTLLMVRFAFPGDAAEGERLAKPLRDAAPVLVDGVRPMPAAEVATIHNDPTDPAPGFSRGTLLNRIDQDFVTTLLGIVGTGQQTPIMLTEIRHIGAATHRDVPEGSAVGGRAAEFALSLIGAPNPALFADVLPGATAGLVAALGAWVSAETNINFAGDPAGADFARAWPAATTTRLVAERAAVDPDGTFAYGREQ